MVDVVRSLLANIHSDKERHSVDDIFHGQNCFAGIILLVHIFIFIFFIVLGVILFIQFITSNLAQVIFLGAEEHIPKLFLAVFLGEKFSWEQYIKNFLKSIFLCRLGAILGLLLLFLKAVEDHIGMKGLFCLLVNIDNSNLLDSLFPHILQCTPAYLVAGAVEFCVVMVNCLGQDFSLQVNISLVFRMNDSFLCGIEAFDNLLACIVAKSPEESST